MSDSEEWAPIPGFEEHYEASTEGRIRSLWCSMGQRSSPRNLSPTEADNGYLKVDLHKDGSHNYLYVHQVIARTFLGKCPDGLEVNHIDGDKQNNSPHNLQYVTPHENSQHAAENGLLNPPSGHDHWKSKLSRSEVKEVREKYASEDISQSDLAEEYGVDQATISNVVNFKTYN